MYKLISFVILTCFSNTLLADSGSTSSVNISAIVMFLAFVFITLGITYWSALRMKSTNDFYTAGGGISGFKNGLALAGDFMSAASFLGISAMVYLRGFDGLIYSAGFLVGWPIVLFLISERLRNLGKFTFSDVASYRLKETPIRIFSATGTLLVVALYLIAQVVGAGKLIEVLFGLNYEIAVVVVAFLMVLYVLFGGMIATTWVQIIKAVLLLSGATFISFMVLKYVGFSLNTMFEKATSIHENGLDILAPGGLLKNPIDALSLGLALMFGTAGLPHILMRFFTVPDAKAARTSVFVATGFIGYFYLLTFIIGFGSIIMILKGDLRYFTQSLQNGQTVFEMIGGTNMVAIHLSNNLGGSYFLGFISAVAFATILAVVAGLTLSGASAVSHDLYSCIIKKGNVDPKKELFISRITTVTLGIIAIILGLLFEKQNIAFMVGLAFALAASGNFPILVLSMFWKGLTTRGAVIGGFTGLISATMLIIFGPNIWVEVLGNENPIFPYSNPALFTIPLAFFSTWLFSVTDNSEQGKLDKSKFQEQYIRSVTGIGASQASKH